MVLGPAGRRLTVTDDDGGAGSHQHGDGSGAAGGPGAAAGVDRHVPRHGQSQSAVPEPRLDPGHRVEKGRSAPVAGVGRVHPFHVRVAAVFEELHQHRLDALRLVQDRFRPHLQPPDPIVACEKRGTSVNPGRGTPRRHRPTDLHLLHQTLNGVETERVDVLSVVAKAHLLLAQADRVLAAGHTVEAFQIILIDELVGKVNFDAQNTHSARPSVLGHLRQHGTFYSRLQSDTVPVKYRVDDSLLMRKYSFTLAGYYGLVKHLFSPHNALEMIYDRICSQAETWRTFRSH